MNIQSLPTGQIPVRNWPIQDNAWVNVSRNLLSDEISEFLSALTSYLAHVLFEEEVERSLDDDNELSSDEVRRLRTYRYALESGERFSDPTDDLTRFTFKHRAWYWSLREAAWWATTGSVLFGAIGPNVARLFVGSDGSTLTQYGFSFLIFAIALSFLTLRDTVRYAALRMRLRSWPGELSPHSVLGFISRDGSPSVKRHPIFARTARLLLRPLGFLLVVIIAVGVLIGSEYRFGYAEGFLLGLACYLVTRYRVPAIVLASISAPMPHDKAITRRRLTWIMRTPRKNFSELKRGLIGTVRSPLPWLVEAQAHWVSVSAWMFVRAVLDAVWITALGIVIVVGLRRRLHLNIILSFWAGLYFISVILHSLGDRPEVFRINNESFLRAVWGAYSPILRKGLRTASYLLLGLLIILTIEIITSATSMIGRNIFVGIVVFVAFALRLIDQVLWTSRDLTTMDEEPDE
jgi:hypothetical protein